MDVQINEGALQGGNVAGESLLQELPSHVVRRIVSEESGYSVVDLVSRRKTRELAAARHVAMFVTYRHTTLSLSQIARVYNKLDHSTVYHALRRIERDIREDGDTIDLLLRCDHRARKELPLLNLAEQTDKVIRQTFSSKLRYAFSLLGYDLVISPKREGV